MAHKVESPWSGSLVRVKSSVVDDANPQTLQDLATAKVDNLTAVAASSSVSAFDAGSNLWTASELIGATLFLTAGLNGGSFARSIFSTIEANSVRVLSGLVKPGADATAWGESFYDAASPAQGFIRPCGMRCGSTGKVHLSVEFTGGSGDLTCTVTLWTWSREQGKWLKLDAGHDVTVSGSDTLIDGQRYFTFNVTRNSEIYVQITSAIGSTTNPTAVTVKMEEI